MISFLSRKANNEGVEEVQFHLKNPGTFRKWDSNVLKRGTKTLSGKAAEQYESKYNIVHSILFDFYLQNSLFNVI